MPDDPKVLDVTAVFDKETKRTHKYTVNVLGISIGIYVDKMATVPAQINIVFPKK